MQVCQFLRRQAGFDPVLGLDDPITELSQAITQENAHTRVVFDQQDCFCTADGLFARAPGGRRLRIRGDSGKMSNLVPYPTRLLTSMPPPD